MLPKSINVLGQKYKVVKKLPKNHERKGDEAAVMGYFDAFEGFIYVNHNYSKEIVWRSFFHEFYHAVQYRNGSMFDGTSIQIIERDAETASSAIYELIVQLGGFPE
jgi:Zn-dependent peptidase ImmA (M78 family)